MPWVPISADATNARAYSARRSRRLIGEEIDGARTLADGRRCGERASQRGARAFDGVAKGCASCEVRGDQCRQRAAGPARALSRDPRTAELVDACFVDEHVDRVAGQVSALREDRAGTHRAEALTGARE